MVLAASLVAVRLRTKIAGIKIDNGGMGVRLQGCFEVGEWDFLPGNGGNLKPASSRRDAAEIAERKPIHDWGLRMT